MTARAVAAAALALPLAACGSSAKPAADSDDPCATPAGYRALRGELPAGLVPGGTLVAAVKRSGRTTSGLLFFTGGVDDTFATLRAATELKGYQLTRIDNESFEAEVYGQRAGEALRFKVRQIQGCATAAEGRFVRVRAG